MTIPALTLGIAENLAEMETTLQQCGYTWNELANSRESTIRLGLEQLCLALTSGKGTLA